MVRQEARGPVAAGERRVKGTQQDVLDVPDAIDVVASGPAYGGLVNVEAARESGLAKVSSQNLQVDFLAFLASHEADGSGAVAVAGNGAITFKSKNDLAKLVAEFSYEKLKQISAAARALARYVDDLEGELEQADVQVVQLRTQMREAGRVAAQRDAALAEVQRKTGEVEGRLGVTQAELDASEFALEEAERRADEAADQLLSLQSTIREAEERGESAQAKQNEAESLAVKFEEQLLDAERRALASERAKRKLTSELEQLARARADADMRALSANEMVLAMEQRSLAAEEAAERKAQYPRKHARTLTLHLPFWPQRTGGSFLPRKKTLRDRFGGDWRSKRHRYQLHHPARDASRDDMAAC